MKRKIIIFVTILFVALALNGFAHNRHHRQENKRPCPCEQVQNSPNRFEGQRMNFQDGRGMMFRRGMNSQDEQRMNFRKGRRNMPVSIKGFYNGKIAMVSVGNLLTPEETANLQLLN